MAEETQSQEDRPIPKMGAVLGLAWPLSVNAIMLHGLLIIDAFLVSTLGEGALAAMGLATSIVGLLLGVLFSLSSATQILVAQAEGAGNVVALKTAFWCGLLISATTSIIGLLLVWAIGGTIIAEFAHTAKIATDATRYIYVFAIVIICETVSQSISCHFNGTGRTKLPFYSHLTAMPVNVGVSILLIYGLYDFPQLGLTGAAIGSATAAFARLVLLSICLYRLDCTIIGASGWAQVSLYRSIRYHLRFATPIAGTFLSMTMANSVSMLVYARMNINQFAAMTLLLPWVQIVGQLMQSWAQATGILVGQLIGRRVQNTILDRFIGSSWRIAFVIATLVSLIYLGVSFSFDWIYDDLQPETTAALWSFLPVLLIIAFPRTSNSICGNVLRAGGDTVYVMNIFLISQWVFRVPLTVLFVLYLDLSVAWVFALTLFEELIRFPLFHLRLYSGKWKNILTSG